MFTDNELELGGYQQHEWKQNCVRRGDNDFQSRFILSMGVWEEGRARSRADDEMRNPYCYPFLWHIFLLFHDTHRPPIMTFSCCLFLAEIANLLSVAVVVVQKIDKQRKTSREFKLCVFGHNFWHKKIQFTVNGGIFLFPATTSMMWIRFLGIN